MGTFAVQAWAHTSITSIRTSSTRPNSHLLPDRPVVLSAGDGTPILRHSPGRLLRRGAEPNLSGFPANFADLPIKTEVNLEGEEIAIWALKFAHVDAVVPFLKDFLCGNPEYAPLFPILCRLPQASKPASRSLIRPTSTSKGPSDYTRSRSSQTSYAAHKTGVPSGGTKSRNHKTVTSTASPPKRLSTVFIPKGKGYITSTIEFDDENNPIVPASTRSGRKSHSKTTVRSGSFGHLTSQKPETTDDRAKTETSQPKSSMNQKSSSMITQSGGFHLTKIRQSEPSGHTKESTFTLTKSSGPSFTNNSSGRITATRPSFRRPLHSTASSNINSATSSKEPKTTSTGKKPNRPLPSSTSLPSGTELSTTEKEIPSRSLPSRPSRSALDRSKARSIRTRSGHRKMSIPTGIISTITTPAIPITHSSRFKTRTAPTASQTGSPSQTSKTIMSSISAPMSTIGAGQTSSGSSGRSQEFSLTEMPFISTLRPKTTSAMLRSTNSSLPGAGPDKRPGHNDREDGRPSETIDGDRATMTQPTWPKELTGTITVWPYTSTSHINQDQLATTLATMWKRKALEAKTKAKSNHEETSTSRRLKDELDDVMSETELAEEFTDGERRRTGYMNA